MNEVIDKILSIVEAINIALIALLYMVIVAVFVVGGVAAFSGNANAMAQPAPTVVGGCHHD